MSRDLHDDIEVNRWLPGSIELFTADFFKMPKDLPNGKINDVSDTIILPADSCWAIRAVHSRGGWENGRTRPAAGDQRPSRRWLVSAE